MIKNKLLSLVLSSENLTKDEIIENIKQLLKDKHKEDEEEQKELEIILNSTKKNIICCLPSICWKNCTDCEVNSSVTVEPHL